MVGINAPPCGIASLFRPVGATAQDRLDPAPLLLGRFETTTHSPLVTSTPAFRSRREHFSAGLFRLVLLSSPRAA